MLPLFGTAVFGRGIAINWPNNHLQSNPGCGVLCLERKTAATPVSENKIMQTITEETTVTLKMKELCQAILDEPTLHTARESIDRFMADDRAKQQYENLMTKGQALQQKQQGGQQLTAEEIAVFEKERDALMSNPVALAFMKAQEELHNVHESVNKHVSKTLELGRVPTEEDFESGGCGSGCGCGHGHEH